MEGRTDAETLSWARPDTGNYATGPAPSCQSHVVAGLLLLPLLLGLRIARTVARRAPRRLPIPCLEFERRAVVP